MLRTAPRFLLLLPLLASCGCSGGSSDAASGAPLPDLGAVQATSLLGDELRPIVAEGEAHRKKLRQLEEARLAYEAAPEDLDAIIWYGRRLGYLNLYNEAIEIYTRGLELHPGNAKLLRHRGHRYLSLRDFEQATFDLSRALEAIGDSEDELEPDGQPNAKGIPRSTLHFNIYYHLALARWCAGDHAYAHDLFARCLHIAKRNPDLHVAAAHWMYVSARRIEIESKAEEIIREITKDMDVWENHAYLDLVMMYKGDTTAEELLDTTDPTRFATVGYGVGHYLMMNGRQDEAQEVFLRVVEAGNWPAFGTIASEAELAGL